MHEGDSIVISNARVRNRRALMKGCLTQENDQDILRIESRSGEAVPETPYPDRLECGSHRILVENVFDVCQRAPP
jgi:hypothetical protein